MLVIVGRSSRRIPFQSEEPESTRAHVGPAGTYTNNNRSRLIA